MANIDYNFLLSQIWRSAYDDPIFGFINGASNIIVGNNPPYSIVEFFKMNPKFGGTTTNVTGTVASTVLTYNGDLPTNISIGQYIDANNLNLGTTITEIDINAKTITLSQAASNDGKISANIYTSPLIPTFVLNSFIYLASNSIFIGRWGEAWNEAMSLFIAHYATLWMQAEAAGPNSTAGQAVASGLALGIDTAQHAGDVGYASQPVIIDGAGAWNLTLYGQLLATMAKTVGSGMILAW